MFARTLEEKRIPPRLPHRAAAQRHARRSAAPSPPTDAWPRGGFQSRTEETFEFALGDGLEISGKIDRLDVAADGRAYVIDYKYSGAQRIKDKLEDENLLQAPLYLMAARAVFRRAAGGHVLRGARRAEW